MEKETLDCLIIGAGPIGLACGIEAKKKGFNYLIIDKGCLVNSIYNYPYNMTFFSTSEKLEIGNVPFISHGSKPNRVEALEYYRRVADHWELKIHLYEQVNSIQTVGQVHQVQTSKEVYQAKNVVLATGFYDLPFLMNVQGEELPKVHHYYSEPHPFYRQQIAVIGAANSAVDVALETWRKGAEVTMIIRDATLRESVKYWVKPDIENRIKEGSIKAYFNSEVIKITEHSLEILTPQGIVEIPNDFVLAMTGYRPDFSFMKNLGITFHNDEYQTPVYNDMTNETVITGIFLAGVACGGLRTNKWFIENSRIHAELIMNHLSTKI